MRLTAAAMAARSPSSELTIRSPRRRAPSTTLASMMSVARARPARVPVALALLSSRTSTSHPASSRASCAWRGVPRQHYANWGESSSIPQDKASKAMFYWDSIVIILRNKRWESLTMRLWINRSF